MALNASSILERHRDVIFKLWTLALAETDDGDVRFVTWWTLTFLKCFWQGVNKILSWWVYRLFHQRNCRLFRSLIRVVKRSRDEMRNEEERERGEHSRKAFAAPYWGLFVPDSSSVLSRIIRRWLLRDEAEEILAKKNIIHLHRLSLHRWTSRITNRGTFPGLRYPRRPTPDKARPTPCEISTVDIARRSERTGAPEKRLHDRCQHRRLRQHRR